MRIHVQRFWETNCGPNRLLHLMYRCNPLFCCLYWNCSAVFPFLRITFSPGKPICKRCCWKRETKPWQNVWWMHLGLNKQLCFLPLGVFKPQGIYLPTSNMASEKWRKGIWVCAFYIRSWVGPCLFIRRYKLKQNLIAGVHRERYWTASPYQSYYQLFVCQQMELLSGVALLTQHIGFSPSSWMCFPDVNTKVKSFCDPNGKDLEDYRRHQRMVQVRQDVTCSVVYVMLHIDGSYMPIESCTYKRWGCMIVKWFSWVKSCHSCHCSQMTPAPTCWYDIVQPGWQYKLPSSRRVVLLARNKTLRGWAMAIEYTWIYSPEERMVGRRLLFKCMIYPPPKTNMTMENHNFQ